MRYCPNCGNSVTDVSQKFCMKCGVELPDAVENQQTPAAPPRAATQQFPMKWFKFLIYFALFFSALVQFASAINYFTGNIYFSQSNGELTAEMVYGVYGTPLKALNTIYAIILLAMAVFTIITRNKLAKYAYKGPIFLYILYIAASVVSIAYTIGGAIITGSTSGILSSLIGNVVVISVVVYLNAIYFTKRASLFQN